MILTLKSEHHCPACGRDYRVRSTITIKDADGSDVVHKPEVVLHLFCPLDASPTRIFSAMHVPPGIAAVKKK